MLVLCISIAVLIAGSAFAFLSRERQGRILTVSCAVSALGSVIGLAGAVMSVFGGTAELVLSTNLPRISLALGVDGLSSFFLIIIYAVSLLSSVYGYGYMRHERLLIRSAPFFPLLIASMSMVVMSRDALSFLISWELMSLSSFFLVTTEHENRDVQFAGWMYLIATHLATAFLFAFFVLAAKGSGSLLFSAMSATPKGAFMAGLLFVFALIGFGTKAGIFPLHVWLPHAHPAAPSYVSAVMSAVMIKTGIYGILRAITMIGEPQLWWGVVLLVIGVLTAVIGIIYAFVQHDLKRLLAYSSVENIGIIVAGIGVGVTGASTGHEIVAALGFLGALFHVLNHAIFKGLLFFGAGSVVGATGTRSIDRLGGLIKKIPVTGVTFLVASLSICALPPFNGFIGEWFIYAGALSSVQSLSGFPVLATAAAAIGIAFAGGLAVACFTKVFGVAFLGEPRTDLLQECREPSSYMLAPMGFLAAACLVVGVAPQLVLPAVMNAVRVFSPMASRSGIAGIMIPLDSISIMFAVAVGVCGILAFVFLFLLRKRPVASAVTWDCGYVAPAASMQYTGQSFAEPVATFFRPLLRPVASDVSSTGFFPHQSQFRSSTADAAESRLFSPLFGKIGALFIFVRSCNKKTVQSYLMLIFFTLLLLLIWEVCFGF